VPDPCKLGGPSRRLVLRQVESGRHGNHRGFNLLPQALPGIPFQGLKDLRRELLGSHPAAVTGELVPVGGPHLELELGERVVVLFLDPLLGFASNDQGTSLIEPNSRGGEIGAFVVFQDLGSPGLHDRDFTVRGSKVDPRNRWSLVPLPSSFPIS